jgi:16S rRNA (guanine966-N2)-methyltransferase
LRIIGGRIRGRKLLTPGKRFGALIRPTSDRAREALFNILGSRVTGARVLDLFAGTGALGLEALSRGATSALFVDASLKAVELIERNVAACGFAGQVAVLRRDLTTGLAFLAAMTPAGGFDLVLLDPPYGEKIGQRLLESLAGNDRLSPAAVVVLEDRAREECPDRIGSLLCFDRRRYGEAGFWLYRTMETEDHE